MNAKVAKLIDEILRREGGYVNHPMDRGGPTNFGITAQTLGEHRGLNRPATAAEVRELHRAEAVHIYNLRYVSRPNFDKIGDAALQEAVVDFGVHSGPATAARHLQSLVGVNQDGRVGPITLEAVANADPEVLANRLNLSRAIFLLRLVGRNPTQAAFARGWGNRLAELARIE